MVTYEQAMIADSFYHIYKENKDGTPVRLRRNGKTKTWKSRPGQFSIPVKYGLRDYGYITHDNAHEWAEYLPGIIKLTK